MGCAIHSCQVTPQTPTQQGEACSAHSCVASEHTQWVSTKEWEDKELFF